MCKRKRVLENAQMREMQMFILFATYFVITEVVTVVFVLFYVLFVINSLFCQFNFN